MDSLDKSIFTRWIITCLENDLSTTLNYNGKEYRLGTGNGTKVVTSWAVKFNAVDFFKDEECEKEMIFGYDVEDMISVTYQQVPVQSARRSIRCIINGGWYNTDSSKLFLLTGTGLKEFRVVNENAYLKPKELITGFTIPLYDFCCVYQATQKGKKTTESHDHTFKVVGDEVRVSISGNFATWNRDFTEKLTEKLVSWTLTEEEKDEIYSTLGKDFIEHQSKFQKYNNVIPPSGSLFCCLPTPDLNVRTVYSQADLPLPESIAKIFATASQRSA